MVNHSEHKVRKINTYLSRMFDKENIPFGLSSYCSLIFIFLLETLIFVAAVKSNVADIYPRFNDQIQYLSDSYLVYEKYLNEGLLAGLWYGIREPAAQGITHRFFALIAFMLFGASRLSALLVNLFAFMLWQAITFSTMRKTNFTINVAWISMALLLCLQYSWLNVPGSALDFRLDHLAMCFMGISIMAAVKSDGFLSRKWSILFGLAVGITILTRFLTAVYFLGIALFLILVYLRSQSSHDRIKNILIAMVVAFVLIAPIFLHNYILIYNYYVVGHLTGVESDIRASGKGFLESLAFVINGVIGFESISFWFILLLIPFIGYVVFGRKLINNLGGLGFIHQDVKENWQALGLTFFIVPLLMLALHKQVSPAVLGILVPGIFVLVMSFLAPLIAFFERCTVYLQARRYLVIFLVGISFSLGFFNYTYLLLYSSSSREFISDSMKLNLIVDDIYERLVKSGIKEPTIASDRVTDFLDAQIFRVIIYERKKVWLPLVMTLPTGIFKENDQFLMERLYKSDLVFVTDSSNVEGSYPYDEQMQNLYPKLLLYCEENMVKLGRYHFFDRDITLYARPSLALD